MKKRKLNGLQLNKRSISKLDNKKGGMVPPPPPTQMQTCGIGNHGACPTVDTCIPLTADCLTNDCGTMFWCGPPSNHPSCFESQDINCIPIEI